MGLRQARAAADTCRSRLSEQNCTSPRPPDNVQQGEVTRGDLIRCAELANRPLQRTIPLCHRIVGGSSVQRSCEDHEHCHVRKGAQKPEVSHRRGGA